MQCSDVLQHRSYTENTGRVKLEAMIADRPSIVSDVCGYAHYVKEAKAGILIKSPYSQNTFNSNLEEILLVDKLILRNNGINFSNSANIYDMPLKAADVIDRVIKKK